jgi:hypothetical protein
MSFTRAEGLANVSLVIKVETEGVNINPEIFKTLDFENEYLEQVHACFDWNFENYVSTKVPDAFRFKKTGFLVPVYWNPKSEYEIVQDNGHFYLTNRKGEAFDEIYFEKKPAFYNKTTSDGKKMSRIAQTLSKGRVAITYSNECSLKDKGLDCLFCNINDTKNRFGEIEHLEWKTPQQIAEVVAEAYKEGFVGYNLTGGFIPERREVEYYIDVIEAVIDQVGTEDVHGMACVGAPTDLSVIEKYKEAGYQHIATNLEVWDRNIFKTICPGKEQLCGGRDNWIAALKHEVEVFGKGNVRSILVAGLEPKESLLEGIEYLASIGVMGFASIWKPCIGSALEGHRSPEPEWHQDVVERIYKIHRKYGFTLENMYYSSYRNGVDNANAYLYKLDGDHLPWEEKLDIVEE